VKVVGKCCGNLVDFTTISNIYITVLPFGIFCGGGVYFSRSAMKNLAALTGRLNSWGSRGPTFFTCKPPQHNFEAVVWNNFEKRAPLPSLQDF
jgi:hypothetical protein